MNRDFRLGDRFDPAAEFNRGAGVYPALLHHEADQRLRNAEPSQRRRRAKADLPAERHLAGIKSPAARLQLPRHPGQHARIVDRVAHDLCNSGWTS